MQHAARAAGSGKEFPLLDCQGIQLAEKIKCIANTDMELLQSPCHFMLGIDTYSTSDEHNYRNIDTANLQDESGCMDIYATSRAYLADTVVDTYIREYGGMDCTYIADASDGAGFKIRGNGAVLEVLGSTSSGDVPDKVLIRSGKDAASKSTEFVDYILCSQYLRQNDLHCDIGRKTYWMVINPEHVGSVQRFRNVSPRLIRRGSRRPMRQGII